MIKHFLILSVLAVLSSGAHASQPVYSGTGKVNYVVDGDTMDIRVPKSASDELVRRGLVSRDHVNDRFSTFRVRLANVDTDESVHKDSSRNTSAGAASSSYVQSLILNKQAKYTCFDIGYYGRAICSLEVEGLGDLGLHLIREGHSSYETGFGRHPFLDAEYRAAERNSTASANSDDGWIKNAINNVDAKKVRGIADSLMSRMNSL